MRKTVVREILKIFAGAIALVLGLYLRFAENNLDGGTFWPIVGAGLIIWGVTKLIKMRSTPIANARSSNQAFSNRKNYRAVWPFLLVSGLLVTALLPLPYGYYSLLRVAVIACCWYGITSAPQYSNHYFRWALFIPLMWLFGVAELPREQWAPIDLAVAVVFCVIAGVYRISDGRSNRDGPQSKVNNDARPA